MFEDPSANETAGLSPGPDEAGAGSAASFYLDDLEVGQRFTSGSLTVTEAEIKAFAARFDPQPFHLDEAAAEESVFGELVASGWHTASLSMRLMVEGELRIAGGLIGMSGEMTWPRPTRPGDVLSVETEVLEVVPSKSRPDRGIATVRSTTLNQLGEPLQIATFKLMVPRRPGVVSVDRREARG